nr:serine/arginine repetitive matrix protein 2 [Aegilops tauschii subsp. strangulata]
MDQHQREDQRHLLLHKEEEQDDSLRTWKEQLLGPDVVHTTSLLGEKTSSVQLQGSPGNAACSVLSSSVGPSEALPIVVGLAWTLQNGGNAAPMQSPGVDSLSVHKRGRGRPRKDQQSRQANPPPPPTPTASRRGIKVGCGRPMLAPTSHLETHRGPPGSWRPIIIEKLLAACWSVDAASTGIKRPRGRPRMYTPSAPDTGDAASAGIKRGRGRPRKERPDAASSGIKRGRGRPRKEKPEARMCAETGYAFASTGIKRGGGHPELEMEMLAAAAAMLAETGDDAVPKGTKGVVENPRSVDVVSTGMEGALENPNPRTENPSAGDVMSMVMKRGRGRPRKNQQPQAPTTPAALSTGGIKRGRGRPRKDQQPQAPTTPAALSTGGIKRGRGRPRKEQQSQAPTTPTALSTGGIKIGHGRPRKEQQSEPKPPLTPTVSRRRGIKVGCGRPMIIEKPPAARSSVDAALSGIKRPRGRPRKETASVGMSAETGDATPAPETGDAAASTVMKRGRGRPRKAGIKRGVCGEAGDAATGGTSASKRGRGRPRKEERRDGAVSGMERGRGRPRKEKAEEEAGMDMLAAAAAAMLAESGWR